MKTKVRSTGIGGVRAKPQKYNTLPTRRSTRLTTAKKSTTVMTVQTSPLPLKLVATGSRQPKRLPNQPTIKESWNGEAKEKKSFVKTASNKLHAVDSINNGLQVRKIGKEVVIEDVTVIEDVRSIDDDDKAVDDVIVNEDITVVDDPPTVIEDDTPLSPEKTLNLLKSFDLDKTYGPCRGISRLQRYERALKFRVNPRPTNKVVQILGSSGNDPEIQLCIWDFNELLKEMSSPYKS